MLLSQRPLGLLTRDNLIVSRVDSDAVVHVFLIKSSRHDVNRFVGYVYTVVILPIRQTYSTYAPELGNDPKAKELLSTNGIDIVLEGLSARRS